MSFPVPVPAVRIYAGDTVTFPGYRIKDDQGTPVDLSEWSSWKAQWKQAVGTSSAELDIDESQLPLGWIVITASSTQTRQMGQPGRFDVSATRNGETRTWVYGDTVYEQDVHV